MFELGAAVDVVWGVLGTAGAVASIALLLYIAAKGHADRHAEEDARDFYDAHGHWPDEDGVRTP